MTGEGVWWTAAAVRHSRTFSNAPFHDSSLQNQCWTRPEVKQGCALLHRRPHKADEKSSCATEFKISWTLDERPLQKQLCCSVLIFFMNTIWRWELYALKPVGLCVSAAEKSFSVPQCLWHTSGIRPLIDAFRSPSFVVLYLVCLVLELSFISVHHQNMA